MIAWAAALLGVVAPRALPGQGRPGVGTTPTVASEQSLTFGTMMPGVVETVAVTDAWRRARIRIDGSGTYSVRFIVPATLTSSSGATIPLTFGATDAAYNTQKSSALTTFDPQFGSKVSLTAGGGTVWIYLGGVASPAAQQTAGPYSATVTIVIAPPNM